MVKCPACDLESLDSEFCDHCNSELDEIFAANDAPPNSLELEGGESVDCAGWGGSWPSDPFQGLVVTSSDGRTHRAHGLNSKRWAEFQPMVEQRSQVELPILPRIKVVPVNAGAIVLAEAGQGGPFTLNGHGSDPAWREWVSSVAALVDACRTLHSVLKPLHDRDLVWLNFDPEQLEDAGDCIRVTNLDLAVYKAYECPASIRISPRYSPPEVCRFRGDQITSATDVFHMSMYAYYWLAGLLPSGFPGRGLEAFDFEFPPLRIYKPNLPPGIAPVVERGLRVDPKSRFPSTQDFLADLEAAVWRAGVRYVVSAKVRHEIGGLTRAGRAKTAMGSANQDQFAVFTVPVSGRPHAVATQGIARRIVTALNRCADGFRLISRTVRRALPSEAIERPFEAPAALVCVLDGVSTARIGSGERASRIACDALAKTASSELDLSTRATIAASLSRCFVEAGTEIVRTAIDQGQLPPDFRESDVMSTTAVVGLLHGNVLHIANAGDSRAYLIEGPLAEQLTVDGDVRSTTLAAPTPPEHVRDMGVEAKSLRCCLGACRRDPNGATATDVERSTPQIAHWPLRPGDVLVLCTDGLVEEGVFLGPDEVAAIVRDCRCLSAQAIAERLVDAADALQRLPSVAEPNGFGDNITCAVIKVIGDPPPTKENG